MGIVVVDFGGQYAHLIANRIRRLNVYTEIRSPMVKVGELENVDGVIFSGGPSSVYDKDAPPFIAAGPNNTRTPLKPKPIPNILLSDNRSSVVSR